MSQQIAQGLFETKLDALSAQTQSYVSALQALSNQEGGSATVETLNTQLRSMLSSSPTPVLSLSLKPRERSSPIPPLSAVVSSHEGMPLVELPDAFVARMQRTGTGKQIYQPISLPGSYSGPGLVLAQEVVIHTVGSFELVVTADLREEQNTLRFVQRALLVSAVVLLVLVGAIAWIVTHLVVTPVRTGAETARRLADGDLDQRMTVNGQDEIAALAESFNDMAEALQNQITRMEQLTVIQRRFVSDVSHELRTPLTTINIASDMLYEKREELPESTRRSVELLKSQVERFEELLNDLLEISRFDAGVAQIVTSPTDIVDLVAGVVEGLSVVAAQSDTELRLSAPGAPLTAEIDRVRITRIVRNLIVNAIEHGEGKPIDISLAANATAIAISVRDHGVGMSEEQVEQVFDRFWRADPSRRRTLGGSGLGLAIALEDAHLHDGWLQAWGREGRGACFRLTLPRQQGENIVSSPLPLPPADALIHGTALVAGPSTSDGSVRVHTGSIPIIVEASQNFPHEENP